MNLSNFGAVRHSLLSAAVLAFLAVPLSAQVVERGRTLADLIASHPCDTGLTNRIARVTDCDAADDLGDGEGAVQCWAYCDGSAPWVAVSIGGGAGASGPADALASAVVIEGTTADAFEGNFTFADPTADWTWAWGATGTPTMPSGASITTAGGATIAFDTGGAGRFGFATTLGGAPNFYIDPSNGRLAILNDLEFGWSSNLLALGNNTGVKRFADGVLKVTDGGSGVRGLVGGGTAIASATALPVPTGSVFHVTGTTDITSMTATNLQSGVCVTMIFDDVLTLTDGNNLKLAGNFVTTADDVWRGCYDGTNFYESSRSVN